ncbi:hypothetical protein J6590_057730 [Homalodisca vitripennis]|nr:hypothetical protein J6590_057730 [Homalodisca vitripennis]
MVPPVARASSGPARSWRERSAAREGPLQEGVGGAKRDGGAAAASSPTTGHAKPAGLLATWCLSRSLSLPTPPPRFTRISHTPRHALYQT